jgi:hypothetical protein
MTQSTTPATARQTAEIDEFLEELKSPAPAPTTSAGRLVFALDATASRQPTWDQACQIQGEMFEATTSLGRLEIQLMFYRGFNECKASRWLTSAAELHAAMRAVSCIGGHTQIGRVLDHTIREAQKAKVGALIFVGDALEELPDPLCQQAGELGKLGVPMFVLQEGSAPDVTRIFKQLAHLSGGVHLGFDRAGVTVLKTLLGAIAVYATGGYQALVAYGDKKGGEMLRLTSQLQARKP